MTPRSNAQGRRTVATVEEAALDLAKILPYEEITVGIGNLRNRFRTNSGCEHQSAHMQSSRD